MKRKNTALCVLLFVMTVFMCVPVCSAAGKAADGVDKAPYMITVSKSKCLMTVYSKNKDGEYTTKAKEFKTALGKTDASTPKGKFTIKSKEEWHKFSKNYYAKYASNFADGLYIYSSLFDGKDITKPIESSVRQIGSKSTSGCLLTTLESAEWIYKNCPVGTVIEIID